MFSNKAKFIGSAGISALVSCLASSFSFAHEGDLRMGTYLYAGNGNYGLFNANDVDNVDELIDEFVNENNDVQLNNGDEYRKGDLEEENINKEVEKTHTEGRAVLQNSVYLEKDGFEDSLKEQKFVYLKDDEDENIYAKPNQSTNKKEAYPDAVKYGSVSSDDYKAIPDSVKYGSVSSEKGLKENKKYFDVRKPKVEDQALVFGLLFACTSSMAAAIIEMDGNVNRYAMERAMRSKNGKWYFNGELLN